MCYNLSPHALEVLDEAVLGKPLQILVSKHAGRHGARFRNVMTDALVPESTLVGPLVRALSTGAAVTSFTLINGDTDQPIAGFENLASGATLNLATLPTKNLNIVADTSGSGIGSVRFQWDSNSNYRTENTVPYAFAADSGTGDYYNWTPSVGSHTLGATVYSKAKGAGTKGATKTITFNVIDSAAGGGSGQSPFLGTAVAVPGFIEAENYDKGGEGVAYHDADSANVGGAYRSDGVDLEPTSDSGGGYNVGHIRAGEWLEYTINVPNSGTFNLDARVASGAIGGATFHVEIDGANKTGTMNLPFTGNDWQTWTTVSKTNISLTAGTHVMRVAFDTSAAGGEIGNLNSLRFSAPSTVTTAIAWSAKANAPLARDEAAGVAIGTRLFVFGGFYGSDFIASTRLDVYDTATNKWSSKRNMPEALTHAPAIYDGQYVWFIGGYIGNNPAPSTTHVWRYDPATDTWAAGPALPSARGAGAAALVGRDLHYFGGRDLNRTVDEDEHWVLNLDNLGGGWSERADLPDARNHLAGMALDGKVYAIGGQTNEMTNATDSTLVDAYDPATDAWKRIADLPAPRSHVLSSTFIRNGQIMVIGGENAHNGAQASVWGYDPVRNKWITYTSLPANRRAAVAALINDQIIVTGGYDGFVHSDDTWAGK